MGHAPFALEMIGVSKRYGPVVALDRALLTVRSGTVHGLLGENGAGKTTLMHVAYGLVGMDSGEIRIGGRRVSMTSPLDAIAHGVGMVHQHFTLVPAMTVEENLALGGTGLLRKTALTARVREISHQTGFALDPNARVDALPVGAQQRVEIAKALTRNASLLILDEPTAVLAPREIVDLLRWLRDYVSAGNSAVLITHKLREALDVADDVTVLRRGRVVFTGTAARTSAELLTESMLGVAGSSNTPVAEPPALGSVVFDASEISVVDASGRSRVRHASFVVRAGELVGVAAVEGAGQRELLRALAGRLPVASGRLSRPDAVGFVPEDRHHDAILLDRPLAETVALRNAGERSGAMDWSAIRERTSSLMREFDIRTPSAGVHARALSGGNQQKLVLARELEAVTDAPAPTALVVENPTRGLDVRATHDVHDRLRDACARGAAVVIYSSDLDEVLSLATRVLVMFAGTVAEVPFDRDAIGRAMVGLA